MKPEIYVMHHFPQNAELDWKQLLQLSELLTNQTSADEQCELVSQFASRFLAAEGKAWLASPAYPLWGKTNLETLPKAEATPLAHAVFSEQKIVYSYQKTDDTLAEISLEPGNGPLVAIALPLITRNIFLGVLQVDAREGQFLDENTVALAKGIAQQAATAMESTRQEAVKNWYLEQLALVRSVSAQIASFSRLEDLYAHVTELIQETFDYDYVAILTFDDKNKELVFRGSAGRKQRPVLPPGFSVKPGEGIVGMVGESGEEIVSPNVHDDSRYRFIDLLPLTRAEATLPLKIENRILGVLDFQCDQIDAFKESDILVLRSLADNIALAIESKYLTYGLERRAEQISSVFEISHAINSILEFDQQLNNVVKLIQNRFGYPFVHIYTVHLGRRLVIYQTGTGNRSENDQTQQQHYHLDDPKGIISWVARNGKTFLSNDISQEPLYLPPDSLPHDTRSELTIPLMHGEEVLGILDIQSRDINAFDENDQSLFEALAVPIAVAMRNANLYHSEQWRRKVAESFRDVAHLISANLPLNELLDVILEKLESNLPCDVSAIWLLDEDLGPSSDQTGHRLRLAATRNIPSESILTALQEKSVQEMLERSLQSKQPLIRQVDEPFGPLGAAMGFDPNYSSIAAKMGSDDQPLGVLSLAHHQDGRYGSEAQAITATFASYASVAIQNASLYHQIQGQALISTMLLQVAEASQTIMTIDDLLATMVRMTRLLMGVKKCAFLIWEENLQSYRMMSWYGFDGGEGNQRLFSPQLPSLVKMAKERTTIYIEDPATGLDLPELGLNQGTIVMLPLLVRGNMVGGFLVGLQMAWVTGIETGFDPKALAILQGIAHQTAMTIDNLRLLEARQEEAYVTAALLQVAQAVVSSNDLNDTLDTIVHLLPILVGIDTCIIYLWDSINHLFRPTQVYAENRREEEIIIGRPFSPGEYPLLDLVRQEGEMHLCQIPESRLPFQDWIGLPGQLFDQLTFQSILPQGDWVLGYPLSLQGQVFGVLVVRESNASSAFWERRLEIIQGIAQQTSLAIQNDLFKQELVQTERIEREIQLARQIQETFLPEILPKINSWELDLRWETAREVGGDFYDIIKLAENRMGLVIADVSDKGLPAALYMTVARTLIRANASGGQTPAEVLKEVNRLLLNDSADAMFITAVYAILDLETGELHYANAGHNRPLLYRRKQGKIEQLPKGGTALGILEDLELANHHLTIHPGESLILYTDGVTDALSPEGDFFGEPRLFSLIADHGKESIQDMLEYLDDALIEFRRGVAPIDDITLLAVQRKNARRKRQVKKPG